MEVLVTFKNQNLIIMQVLFGILLVFLAITAWFLYDRNKKRNEIAAVGGMERKYAVLIDVLTDFPNAKIIKRGPDFIEIEYRNEKSYFFYDITQHWSNVRIRFYQKSKVSEIDRSWTFPETMDQELMLQQILNDLDKN